MGINLLKSKRKNKSSDELSSDEKDLTWELIDDQTLLTPKSVYEVFCIVARDPH